MLVAHSSSSQRRLLDDTNFNQALMMTKRVIHQLKKKGQLEMFPKEIYKKIEIGTLVEMSDDELKETMKTTHHFCYLAMVMSETSTSTSAILINNTKTQVPGQGLPGEPNDKM